jgi:hypothetical protein
MRAVLSSMQRMNWPILACLGLFVFLMAPILQSGYIADDAGNSLIHGLLAYHRVSILEVLRRVNLDWMPTRFTPLAFLQMYSVFYVFTDRVVYKAFIIVCLTCNLLGIHRLVFKLTDSKAVATGTLLIITGLFQFRDFFDPILAFNGLLPTLLFALLVSYLTLIAYLDSCKKRWLVVSVVAYLAACLTYEICYPLVVVHLAILVHRRGVNWSVLVLAGLFCSVVMFCVAAALALRYSYGAAPQAAYRPNLDPLAFSKTWLQHLVAAMPLSYSLAKPEGYTTLRYMKLGNRTFLAVTAVSALVSLGALARIRQFISEGGKLNCRSLAIVGVLLWALPAVPVSLSPRYQREVYWGVAYLPIYIQYFGMGCLIMAVGIAVLHWLRQSPRWSLLAVTVSALLLALTLSITYRSNCAVVREMAKEYREERDTVESALRSGLMADVPEGSVLLLNNRHPWWHDYYSRYFYMEHTGKRFVTCTLPSYGEDRRWEVPKGLYDPPTISTEAACYAIKETCECAGHGFVLLSKLEDDAQLAAARPTGYGTRSIRLFVQGGASDERFRRFRVTARRLASDDPPLFVTSNDLMPISESAEGATYEIPVTEGTVDADTLEARWSEAPIEIMWSVGFYSAESANAHTWHWSDKRGVLFLVNSTSAEETVRLSLSATALAKSSLRIESTLLRERMTVGTAESPLERTICVPPGLHVITLTSDSQTLRVPNDPRNLAMCLRDLKVERVSLEK